LVLDVDPEPDEPLDVDEPADDSVEDVEDDDDDDEDDSDVDSVVPGLPAVALPGPFEPFALDRLSVR
jgi:hypothetical protein